MAKQKQDDIKMVEIRPNEFEAMAESNVKSNGDHAGFFHTLGRALGGEKVDNKYLKSDGNVTTKQSI